MNQGEDAQRQREIRAIAEALAQLYIKEKQGKSED